MSNNINYLEGLNPENITSFGEQNYYTMVNNNFDNQKDLEFSNSMPAHALFGMYKMFDMAQKSVVIFSGELKEQVNGVDFYKNSKFLSKVEQYLSKEDTKLNIITEKSLETGHAFNNFLEKFNKKITIKVLQNNDYTFSNHFMVADKVAFRYEESEGHEKVQAVFNFNNPKTSTKLSYLFSLLNNDSR